jgi:spermidine synthase
MIPLAAAVFFTSGFAALLYQVIWQRLLVLFSGADLYSVTIIVAAFMGGMGAGHLAGGQIADRISSRAALLLFALAECAIAVFGFFSRALYYDVLYGRLGDVRIPAPMLAGLLFLSLLWPTFFMGASLPLLARALTSRIDRAASVIGLLYGVNTLGAAAGAIVSTWVLLPRLGLEGSLRVGASLNIACAAVLLPAVLMFRRRRAATTVPTADAPSPAVDEAGHTFGFGAWALIFAFSGLLALSLEIVWFRLLAVMLKGTAFTFGTLLGVYLTGIGLGALAGSAIAPRVRRPAVVFLGLQAVVGLTAMVLLTAFVRRVDDTTLLSTYLGGSDPVDVRDGVSRLAVALYVAVPAMLVLPPTLLMGCAFPVLQRVVQTSLGRIGRRVGVLLLANVAGSMIGTVLTGFVLLDRIGTAGTMRLLAAMSSLFAALALVLARRAVPITVGSRRIPSGVAAVCATAALFVPVLAVMPGAGTLWAHMHGRVVEQIVFGEDGSGLSVVATDGHQAIVFVNGLGESTIPYGGLHTALGALPAFIHPSPRRAVVIGLGSGDTVHAVAGRHDIERVTCVEIIRGQLGTLIDLSARLPYGGLQTLLHDPRIEQIFGDGRIYLRRGGQYDIIEADALRPSIAYSGNVYSDAYFALVREHLAPNGLAATWAPTQRVYNTFIRAFPYVVQLPGILIGSRQPIQMDRPAIDARLADPRTREYFGAAGIDIERLVKGYLEAPIVYGPDFPRQQLTDIDTDLFPKDEFDLSPRR